MRIEGLILAAGLSSRAPGFKMTLPLGNLTVIEHTIKSMMPICQRIVVVGGFRYEALLPICDRYEQVELVVNPEYERGMFSSVKCGMKALTCDRFFMTPGDYPLVRESVYRQLLEHDGDVIIPSYNRRSGHPILVKAVHIPACIENTGFKTMRDFIKTMSLSYITVEDEGVLMDIDTAEDYEKIRRRYTDENNR